MPHRLRRANQAADTSTTSDQAAAPAKPRAKPAAKAKAKPAKKAPAKKKARR